MSLQERIDQAIKIAVQYGGIDGDHHKAFVIDQMVRSLTGCPQVQRTAKDWKGEEYTYMDLGESDEYKEVVRKAKEGKDGPDTYDWEVGVPP